MLTPEVRARIESQLAAAPVVLYMKGSPDFPQCGFSAQAVAALRACKTAFQHVNIFEEPEVREGLKEFSQWPTYPQLYVKGELIGGCDIMSKKEFNHWDQMYRSGELQQVLAAAN